MSESDKWKFVLDNTLKLGSVGFLLGSAVGMVAFKNVAVRMGIASLGAGTGVGKSYVDARYVFHHDVAADRSWIATVKPIAKPKPAAEDVTSSSPRQA